MLKWAGTIRIEIRAFNRALVLHADHELNASTFCSAGLCFHCTDIYSCVTAAIGALKGSLHGGANECVFDMLKEIKAEGDTNAYLDRKLAS